MTPSPLDSSDEEKLEPSRFPSTERAGPKSPQEVNPAREKRWIQTRLQMKKGLSFVNPSEDLSEDKASKISRQSTRRSIRIEYTEEETETLRKGVEEFGLSWKEILKKYSNIFSPNERTVQKLKSHWRYLKRKSKSEKHEIRKMIKANPKISKYMMQKKNNLKTTFATKNLDSEFEETMKRDMSGDQKLSSKAPLQRSARKEVGSTKIEKRFKGLHGKISAAPELRNASKAARTRKEDKNDVPGGEKAKASIRWWTPKEDEALREGVENQRGNKMISWVYILKNYSQIFSPNKRSPRALKLHWLYSRKERELRQQNK